MSEPTRRQVLRTGWKVGGAALLGAAGYTAYEALSPLSTGAAGGRIEVGSASNFSTGTATYFAEGRFYVVNVGDQILALSQKCPHLGCVVPWRPDDPTEDSLEPKGRFNCPCHGSIYDRFGVIRAGPAPRPMDIMAVSIENGNLVVDTGKITQRTGYDPGQAFKG